MGLGGGTEISQRPVRFSRVLLMMNVMFETSVLSVNWRGSAVGMHSDGVLGRHKTHPDWPLGDGESLGKA